MQIEEIKDFSILFPSLDRIPRHLQCVRTQFISLNFTPALVYANVYIITVYTSVTSMNIE